MNKRVVITGMGTVNSIGNSVKETWRGVKKSITGIDKLTKFETTNFPYKLSGEVKLLKPQIYLQENIWTTSNLGTQFAIMAAIEAIENSKIELNRLSSEKFDVILGTTFDDSVKSNFENDLNIVTIADVLGATGKTEIINFDDSSGSDSIGLAYKNIKMGDSILALAGGVDTKISAQMIKSLEKYGRLSKETNYLHGSAPFDINSKGIVISEGACVFILEEMEHAISRKATILGEIVGYGKDYNKNNVYIEEKKMSRKKAILNSLAMANLKSNEIKYVNANASGDSKIDHLEIMVLNDIFSNQKKNISVSSSKGLFGHSLAASGPLGVMIILLSMRDRYIHENYGLERIIIESNTLSYLRKPHKNINIPYAISNAFGFRGGNITLCIKKWTN